MSEFNARLYLLNDEIESLNIKRMFDQRSDGHHLTRCSSYYNYGANTRLATLADCLYIPLDSVSSYNNSYIFIKEKTKRITNRKRTSGRGFTTVRYD